MALYTGASDKDDSTTLSHCKEPEDQDTEPAPDLIEYGSCSSGPHLPPSDFSDFSDGAEGTAVQRPPQDGELEENQKEVKPPRSDEMLNCIEPLVQGTSDDGTGSEHVSLSVNKMNDRSEDICQPSKDSSNSIDDEDSLEFQDCEQEPPGPLEGKMDSQGKDEDLKDTSEDKDKQLDLQSTKNSVPDIPDPPPDRTLDDGYNHVHLRPSSGDANVDQQIMVQETVTKGNECNDLESSNHPSVSAASGE